jgi:hypothetical protein
VSADIRAARPGGGVAPHHVSSRSGGSRTPMVRALEDDRTGLSRCASLVGGSAVWSDWPMSFSGAPGAISGWRIGTRVSLLKQPSGLHESRLRLRVRCRSQGWGLVQHKCAIVATGRFWSGRLAGVIRGVLANRLPLPRRDRSASLRVRLPPLLRR